jgi:phage shock protein A
VNSDWIKIWVDVAQWLFMLLLGVWGYLRGKDRKNEEAISELREQLNAHISETNERLTRIETGLQHVPTRADIEQVKGAMNTINARVESVDSHVDQLRHASNRIEKYLLENTRHAN